MNNKPEYGFTLVELAIVLMIIGLLIGGILRGQELMENARVNTTIQQVTAYQGATATFQDAYAQRPGDISVAQARIPNCTAANNCNNGDGNGIIGEMHMGYPWAAIANDIASENTQFWKHLALAHLISGITPNATTPDWGNSHPVAKIGGGFFMRASTFQGSSITLALQGHWLVLRRTITGSWTCGMGSGAMEEACTVSPNKAAQIDRKMDDGIAFAGEVMSVSAASTAGCGYNDQGENGPSGYAEGKDARSCDMMFRFP